MMATTTLKVEGMTCGHCVQAVKVALEGLEGVRSAQVDLQSGRATVDYEEGRVEQRQMVGAIMDEGYTAE
ncbi:MAG TPA: cation transporter [Longimicrobiales bacterium]|nr:cation transporter [Longimicrobiales bacterium]